MNFCKLYIKYFMSKAFMKEDDNQQWLHEVEPNIAALRVYLTKENSGRRVEDRKVYKDKRTGKEAYEMTNGLSYIITDEGQWKVI